MKKEFKKNIDEVVNNEEVSQEIDISVEEIIKKNKDQEDLIITLTKQNNDSMTALEMLQKQMQDMQTAFIKMQSVSQNASNASDEKYEVKCRLVNGITIYDPKRVVEREIPYGQTIEINDYEMGMLLKSPLVRSLIKDDVVYFVDVDNYEKLKIYEHLNLSDENLIKIVLNSTPDQLTVELDKLTKSKRNHPVLHSIFYRIVELNVDGKLRGLDYNVRKAIENYFRYNLDYAQMLTQRVKEII